MVRRICVLLLLMAAAGFGATVRLYLKDGSYQLAREYEVKQDRVRFFSTERGEFEEIPLDMVDLARTKKEAADRAAEGVAEAKAEAEEDAAIDAVTKEIQSVPKEPGVYYIHGEKLESLKLAESKIVGNKKRTVLKVLSPVPMLSGKETVELDGESAAMHISEKRPEFFFRLTTDENIGLVKMGPKKNARVVEHVEVVPMIKEIVEKPVFVDSFKKQEGDLLFKIWPTEDLEPGEYALIEFTEGKLNVQTWDFAISRP
jgi:hypothetical protein